MKRAKRFGVVCHFCAVIFLASFPLGCSEKKAPVQTESVPASTYFTIQVGNRPVHMQIAATTSESERGLMGRRELKQDEGMIFIFAKPQRTAFWMRNTVIPLDIGFFTADGILREYYPMYPLDESNVKSRSDQIKFCLEMTQGWYAANQVKAGAQLDLKALRAAVKARGAELKTLGLAEENVGD